MRLKYKNYYFCSNINGLKLYSLFNFKIFKIKSLGQISFFEIFGEERLIKLAQISTCEK